MGEIQNRNVDASVYIFSERLYAGANGGVYGHGDYRAAFLLGAPGQRMALAEAEALGILDYEDDPVPVETIPPEDAPPPEDLPPEGIVGSEGSGEAEESEAAPEDAEAGAVDEEELGDELSELTVAELRDIAREQDISYSGLNKAELIEALEEAQENA